MGIAKGEREEGRERGEMPTVTQRPQHNDGKDGLDDAHRQEGGGEVDHGC